MSDTKTVPLVDGHPLESLTHEQLCAVRDAVIVEIARREEPPPALAGPLASGITYDNNPPADDSRRMR